MYILNKIYTILNHRRTIPQTISNLYIIMYTHAQYGTFVAIRQPRYFIANTRVYQQKTLNNSYRSATDHVSRTICNKAVGKHDRRLCRSPHGGLDLLLLFRRITIYIRLPSYILDTILYAFVRAEY